MDEREFGTCACAQYDTWVYALDERFSNLFFICTPLSHITLICIHPFHLPYDSGINFVDEAHKRVTIGKHEHVTIHLPDIAYKFRFHYNLE